MKITDNLIESRNFKSSPEEEMKEFVLSLARELNLDTGHTLPDKTLSFRSIHLNPKQRDALIPAIEALIAEGLFEEKNGSIHLTKKGRDLIEKIVRGRSPVVRRRAKFTN